MHEPSDVESYGKGHRTFDCPWCGAISGIDPSHIGEHFECPECHKSTKLTPANTRQREMTEPPKEAPAGEKGGEKPSTHEISELESYGRGHRTFDCPWCGAISGVDPSHLGEDFDCPECHQGTKLTSDNTRAGHVTEAAPDAPHVDEKKSKAGLLLVAAVGVVAGIVAVMVVTSGPSDDPAPDDQGVDVSRTQPTDPAPEVPPVETPAVPPNETPPADTPPNETPPGEVPPEDAPPEGPTPEEMEAYENAKAHLEDAEGALADWKVHNADILPKLGLLEACTDVRSEAARLCESYPGPDATQDEARAYNVVMREFVTADAKRVEAATRIVAQLNSERLKPRFLESWESINFYLPYVRETMGQMEAAGQCVESEEYGLLMRQIREAKEALEKATPANLPTED